MTDGDVPGRARPFFVCASERASGSFPVGCISSRVRPLEVSSRVTPMLGHYLHLAARNIPRAGPFVFISIAGLAIGLGAALLIGLYVQDELSYERWLPDSERVYLISVRSPDGSMNYSSPSDVGRWVAADFPQFE